MLCACVVRLWRPGEADALGAGQLSDQISSMHEVIPLHEDGPAMAQLRGLLSAETWVSSLFCWRSMGELMLFVQHYLARG